jgi:hypothetical protein
VRRQRLHGRPDRWAEQRRDDDGACNRHSRDRSVCRADARLGGEAPPLVWQKTGPTSGKTETYWPAIDPVTGDIWVASSFQNEYWIFHPDGRFVEAWGAGRTGPGQFELTTHDANPDGAGAIAFATGGSFFVADVANNRVEKFDSDRNFVTSWGSFGTGNGQFTAAKGIATDGKSVYVADDSGTMQAFDTTGHFLRSFPFPFVLFSLTPSGDLVVFDGGAVLELDGNGQQVGRFDLDLWGLTGSPSQVVADSSRLGAWASGGETMVVAPDGAAIYFAHTGRSLSGWPYLRKDALPLG